MKGNRIDFQALKEEWNYVYQERLGISLDAWADADRQPTPEEDQAARSAADNRVKELKAWLEGETRM